MRTQTTKKNAGGRHGNDDDASSTKTICSGLVSSPTNSSQCKEGRKEADAWSASTVKISNVRPKMTTVVASLLGTIVHNVSSCLGGIFAVLSGIVERLTGTSETFAPQVGDEDGDLNDERYILTDAMRALKSYGTEFASNDEEWEVETLVDGQNVVKLTSDVR